MFGMVFHGFWNPMNRRTEFRLDKYGGYEQTVKIPAEIENCPVTQVGPRAFHQRFGIKEILFPDSLISIDASAFSHCPDLTTVKSYKSNYPSQELNIFCFAFSSCPNLTEFHSATPISIFHQAFENCPNLQEVDAMVNGFGCRAFFYTNVKALRLSDNALWGKGSFMGTKITDIQFDGAISEKVCKTYIKDLRKKNLHVNSQKFNYLDLIYEGFKILV